MINSRAIKDLHPVVTAKCEAHIAACKGRGINIIVTSTLRDDEYQASLYAQGRTKQGSVVTNMNVTGAHGLGLAYDVVPVVNRVAIWNNDKLWSIVGEEGIKLGLVWGGSWKSFVDKPHFELTDGLSSKQLRSGMRPNWFELIIEPDHERILKLKGVDVAKWRVFIDKNRNDSTGKYLPELILKLTK